MKTFFPSAVVLVLTCAAAGQQSKPAPRATPPMKVNVVNVCTPSEEEQKDIATVLARIAPRPVFAPDFEITRGRTSAPDLPVSNWVRIRHEFGADAPFTNVQYGISVDAGGIAETLVFRAREGGDIVQVSIEDKITSGTPAQVLRSDTPPSRIRVERLGKPGRALARCADVNQAQYEPLFGQAATIFGRYKDAVRAASVAGSELTRLGVKDAEPADSRTPVRAKSGTKK